MCSQHLRNILYLASLLLVFSLPGYAEEKLNVYAINYPLTYFTKRIGGEHVNVHFPIPQEVDPAFWTPDQATIKAMQKADLIVLNGAGYEKWTSKVSLPMLRVVDTSRAFKYNLLQNETTISHSHGPGGEHSHGSTASITWLDFSQAALQARAVWKALIRKAPQYKADFTANFESLKNDLLTLDKAMEQMTTNTSEISTWASQPIYQYLARRYQLNVKEVLLSSDSDPGVMEWQKFEKNLLNHQAHLMILPEKPLPSARKRFADLQVHTAIFSPCSTKPEQGDFMTVMRENIDNLQPIFNQ